MRPLASFALLAVLVLAPACSSDPASSSGSSGSSGSSDPGCSFSGTFSGGLTGGIDADGCGTSTGAIFTIAQITLTSGTSVGAKFELVTALKGGELGAVPLKSFEVTQREGNGMPLLVWSSTSCTLTLEKNAASPTNVFVNRFLLAGRGACSAPLEPVAPNTRPAVVVSPFEMAAFINPR